MVVPTARTRSAASILAQDSGRDAVALAVQLVVLELVDRKRPEGVEPDVEGDALDVEPREQLRGEVQARRRRRRRAGVGGVDGLVAARLGERLVDVRRQRRLAGGLAVEADAPASVAERLEQLDRPESLTRPQPPRRARERFPDPATERFEEQHLRVAAGRALQVEPGRARPSCR